MEADDGVGIRTRYVEMFAHVVARFANDNSVAGFDVMNEPNVFGEEQDLILSSFYQDALVAVRSAESEVGAPSRLFFFEPAGEWGSDPNRAADPEDDYFQRHLAEQDRYRYGATLWTWREACGDPHKYDDTRDGRVPMVYGLMRARTHREGCMGAGRHRAPGQRPRCTRRERARGVRADR